MLRIHTLALLTSLLMLFTACASEHPEAIEESAVIPEAVLEPDPLDGHQPVPYEKAEIYLENIRSGGVPQDGIPSIDAPQYLTVKEAADLYDDVDQMFLTEIDDQTYLFPQSILVWHEIVNLEGHGAALTYCPLTGSAITYKHPDGLDTSFGTSGNLLNSNLVMYDRSTGTNISQIDGIGLDNHLEGLTLDTVPTYWIDFAAAKEHFPDALVLSEITGYYRNYTQDPYGSYTSERANNYYTSQGTIFPVMHESETYDFHDKTVVTGIKVSDASAALVKEAVPEDAALTFTLGNHILTAVYDPMIDNIRIYTGDYDLEGETLTDDSGNTWSLAGLGHNGQETLSSPTHFEVMWFAWYAFYPETEVIQ